MWTERVAGVFDREHDGVDTDGSTDLHAAVLGEVVDDRVVQEVRGQLQQECMRTDGRRDLPGGVDGGWRSPEYQDQLLREAVSEYGSETAAARWVATADTSPHVSGGAVDIGSFDATAWLSEHGAEYGLCQIYHNETWHYVLRPEAIGLRCPRMYADPTHDPRMQ